MSVQFSCSVVSDSLWPMDWLQHARLPCPSPTPGAYSYSWPSSQWCHPTTSSSVIPCSSCFQSFPASGSFPMSQLFVSGGQSIGVSASPSIFYYICVFVTYAPLVYMHLIFYLAAKLIMIFKVKILSQYLQVQLFINSDKYNNLKFFSFQQKGRTISAIIENMQLFLHTSICM